MRNALTGDPLSEHDKTRLQKTVSSPATLKYLNADEKRFLMQKN
jgi:hypothetical protein